jgi:hypothetical protein
MTANPGNPLEPILLGPDADEARWWGGSLAIIKAASETTGGQIAVVDNYAAEGAAAPLHIHHNEGEAFNVIHGALMIWVGGKIDQRNGWLVRIWTAWCTAYLHGDLPNCPVPVHHASSGLRSVRAGRYRPTLTSCRFRLWPSSRDRILTSWPQSRGSTVDTGLAQDLPDGRGGDRDTQYE